jgi:hypothetical protein
MSSCRFAGDSFSSRNSRKAKYSGFPADEEFLAHWLFYPASTHRFFRNNSM